MQILSLVVHGMFARFFGALNVRRQQAGNPYLIALRVLQIRGQALAFWIDTLLKFLFL